jgi:integrase
VHVRRTRTKVRGGWLVGTPKTERSRRTVPLPVWLVADLNAHLAAHPAASPDSPLFPGRHRYPDLLTMGVLDWSEPWEQDVWVKRTFKPALTRAKLPAAVRFHDLRHSFASILFAEGVPLLKISRWMGHSSLAITEQIYTHLNPADDAAELAGVNRPTPAASNVRELRA